MILQYTTVNINIFHLQFRPIFVIFPHYDRSLLELLTLREIISCIIFELVTANGERKGNETYHHYSCVNRREILYEQIEYYANHLDSAS